MSEVIVTNEYPIETLSPTGAENPTQDNGKIPYERFKQKVDETNELKRKLAELEAKQTEAERKQLEEQAEYKTLYEQAQAQIEAARVEALSAKKDALLVKAGYADEQVRVLKRTLDGSTDEEIAQAIEELKAVIPPKANYIHQTPMGTGGKPEPKGADDIGKALYERVMKNKK